MKKAFIVSAMIAGAASAHADTTLTVYGDRSQTSTQSTTSPSGNTVSNTSIICEGDMSKICYTRTTTGTTGGSTPQIGSEVTLSIFKEGAVDKTFKGILLDVYENPSMRIGSYKIELQKD